MSVDGIVGACVLNSLGMMGNLHTGEVYYDKRYDYRVDGREPTPEIVIDNRRGTEASLGVIPGTTDNLF